MKILSVTYRATVTPPGDYDRGSMTRTMEATAELEQGVCPTIELEHLVDYVHEALGKPRMAEARAAKLLREVDALWLKCYEQRRQAEQQRVSAKANRETAVRQLAQAAGRQDSDALRAREYAEGSDRRAVDDDARAAGHEERAAKLEIQAEAREQELGVKDARALLKRPKPEPDDDAVVAADDEIPF